MRLGTIYLLMGHGRLVKFNMVKENKDKFYKDIQTAYKKIDNSLMQDDELALSRCYV